MTFQDDDYPVPSKSGVPSRVTGVSAVEIAKYKREGWLVPRVQLPLDVIDRLRDALDVALANSPSVRSIRWAEHLAKTDSSGRIGPSEFFDIAQHPVVVSIIKELLGPAASLWVCQIFCKPANDGMETCWGTNAGLQDGILWFGRIVL